MELHIDPVPHSATVLVQWCITEDERNSLIDHSAQQPLILFVLADPDGHEDRRELYSLEREATHLAFHRGGEQVLHAQVVWSADSEKLRKYFLSKKNSWYANTVIEGRKRLQSYTFDTDVQVLESASATVNVDHAFFAPPPRPWEEKWVNLWFEQPPRDQCQFRRRRFVAYSIQPPAIAVWIIFMVMLRTIIFGIRLFGGMRLNDWRPIVHPLRDRISDMWGTDFGAGGSIFTEDEKGNPRQPLLVIFSPAVWLVSLIVSFALIASLADFTGIELTWKSLAIATTLGAIMITALWCVINFGKYIGRSLASEVKVMESNKEEREREQRRTNRIALERRLQPLVCIPHQETNGIPGHSAPPHVRPTIRLYFERAKAKLCKPFPRG